MAKKKIESIDESQPIGTRDKLVDDIASFLNAANKGNGKIAFVLSDECDDDPATITDWISSGNDILDLVMSNRVNSGFPVGRISEITGLEASGKSLLSMHVLAETQKKGGMAVFIDTETSIDRGFVRAIGVNLDQLLYITCDHVEEIFDHIEKLIQKVRLAAKDKLLTIVVDSVAAASCKTELESAHGKDGYATTKAIVISKAMRKITQMIAKQKVCLIFTNQLRQNLKAMAFSDPWVTSGGKALAYHASLRLRMAKIEQIKDIKKNLIGFTTRCKVVKNRLGPPMRVAEFDLFFDRGMDNYGNWFDVLKKQKLIPDAMTAEQKKKASPEMMENLIECGGSGGKLAIKLSDDKTYEFTKATIIKTITTNPLFKKEVYDILCKHFIMIYKDPSQLETVSEDIEYSSEDDDPSSEF